MEQEEKQEIQDQDTKVEDSSADNPSGDDDSAAAKPEDKDPSDRSPDDNDLSGTEISSENISGSEIEKEDPSASELDYDDLTGSELDDDDLTGDELNDDDLTGNALDENDDTGNITSADAQVNQQPDDQSKGESGQDKTAVESASSEELEAPRAKPLKKIILAAAVVILLSIAGVIAYVLWPTSPDVELETAAVQAPEKEEIVPISMDSFLIPFSHGKFSYISLNVSIEIPTGRLRNEIISEKDQIRGQIYELLLKYVRDLASTPVPNDIKTIISKSVNRSLSNGSVRELYLTQFIVI